MRGSRVKAFLVVCLMGIASVGVSASLVDDAASLLDATCISATLANDMIQQLLPCVDPVSETDCLTIGGLSSYYCDILELKGTFLERLFGLSESEKVEIAQRNEVMAIGESGDTLSGMQFIACLIGLIGYTTENLLSYDCLVADAAATRAGLIKLLPMPLYRIIRDTGLPTS